MELAGAGIVLVGAGAVLWGAAMRAGAGAPRERGNIRILSHHRHKPIPGKRKASGVELALYLRRVGLVLIFAGAMIFWTLLVQHFFE